MSEVGQKREVYFVHPIHFILVFMAAGGFWIFGVESTLQFYSGGAASKIKWWDLLLSWLIFALPSLYSGLAFLTLRLVITAEGFQYTDLFSRQWMKKVSWNEVSKVDLSPERRRQRISGDYAAVTCKNGQKLTINTVLLWRGSHAEKSLRERAWQAGGEINDMHFRQ